MHNWGLAGDINLPLSALFIYLFILLFHFLLVFLALAIHQPAHNWYIDWDKGVHL